MVAKHAIDDINMGGKINQTSRRLNLLYVVKLNIDLLEVAGVN